MPSTINTNLASLNTQNNLHKSQSALQTSIQRLSSGLRVNTAKDDAAGFGIASRMDATIRGQNIAIRNANDAISYSQTTEGGLSQISDNLQRMRELAVQSANGSYGDTDRTALSNEFVQLQDEILRIRESTSFNGNSVLKTSGTTTFQVGSGNTSNDKISISGVDLSTGSINTAATKTTGSDFQSTLKSVFGQNSAADTIHGVTFSTSTGYASIDTSVITGTPSSEQTQAITDYNSKLAAAAAGVSLTGVTFSATTGKATLPGSPSAVQTALASTVNGSTGSAGTSIGTASTAQSALSAIDSALSDVNDKLTQQGAYQNRFTAVINVLRTSVENQTTARSRIVDADYASETSNLARNQILQQAGMAMLAQANQLPNNVLSLLR